MIISSDDFTSIDIMSYWNAEHLEFDYKRRIAKRHFSDGSYIRINHKTRTIIIRFVNGERALLCGE